MMPLYVMTGLDGPEGPAIRGTTRPAHLSWADSLGGALKLAGPMLGADGGAPIGSLLIVETASLEAARELFAQDPYARAGLWASQDIRPFVQVRP
jgi:uncharacterized protein YciI